MTSGEVIGMPADVGGYPGEGKGKRSGLFPFMTVLQQQVEAEFGELGTETEKKAGHFHFCPL